MPIINRFADLMPEMTAWRQDIHAHPELLFDVHRTAGIVADKLRAFGVDEVATGIGRTGVVGVIRGRKAGAGRAIGLRADMDALPMSETTGLPHASTVPGKMHACGHDGHTAMLLGAAKYLAETRNFAGTAVVIFQPAEEGGGGGREMVEDGLMERFGIDEVYGMHNAPGLPVGAFRIREGAFLAASDIFTITINGLGSHAAYPHQGIDPTVVASHVVLALQTIVARGIEPTAAAVVSVTSFRTASDAFNVIPTSVEMRGTARSLDAAVQDLIEARMTRIVTETARAFGAEGRLDYVRNYPVTVNSSTETAFAAEVAMEIAGAPGVDTGADPVMGAEDFAFMLNARPGAFIFVGNGDSAALHNPGYDFNDAASPVGASFWARLVERGMPA